MLRVLGTGAALLLGATAAQGMVAHHEPAPTIAIGGTLAATTGPLAGRAPASVTAVRLGADGEVRGALADTKGRYRLRLTAGMWLVTRTTWAGRHSQQEALLVPGGPKRASLRRRSPVVAVRRFPSPYGIDLAPLLRSALGEAVAEGPCRITLGGETDSAATAAALRGVVRLAPGLGPSARRALTAQRALRPRYVLSGRFTRISDEAGHGETSVTWRLTDVRTGRVLEHANEDYEGGGARRAAGTIGVQLAYILCGVPSEMDGDLRGTVTEDGVTRTLAGAARFRIAAAARRGGFLRADYTLTAFRGTLTEAGTDGAGCLHSGTADSGGFTRMAASLIVRVWRDGTRLVTLDSSAQSGDTILTVTCPATAPSVTTGRVTAGVVSDINQPIPGVVITGGYSGVWRHPFGDTAPDAQQTPLIAEWTLAPLPFLEISKRWPEPPAA